MLRMVALSITQYGVVVIGKDSTVKQTREAERGREAVLKWTSAGLSGSWRFSPQVQPVIEIVSK